MTKEQKLQAYSMRKMGKTYAYIADIFNVSVRTLWGVVFKLSQVYGSVEHSREAKKRVAVELRKSGKTYKEIGQALGINKKTAFDWTYHARNIVSITGLAIRAGMKPITVHKRIKNGMTLEEALTKPVREMNYEY